MVLEGPASKRLRAPSILIDVAAKSGLTMKRTGETTLVSGKAAWQVRSLDRAHDSRTGRCAHVLASRCRPVSVDEQQHQHCVHRHSIIVIRRSRTHRPTRRKDAKATSSAHFLPGITARACAGSSGAGGVGGWFGVGSGVAASAQGWGWMGAGVRPVDRHRWSGLDWRVMCCGFGV